MAYYQDELINGKTERTYTYQRRYILNDGTIKTCNTTTKRIYKKNCITRKRIKFTDEQIKIMIQEYKELDNLKKTVDVIKEKYGFITTPHYINKYWLDRLDYL